MYCDESNKIMVTLSKDLNAGPISGLLSYQQPTYTDHYHKIK